MAAIRPIPYPNRNQMDIEADKLLALRMSVRSGPRPVAGILFTSPVFAGARVAGSASLSGGSFSPGGTGGGFV